MPYFKHAVFNKSEDSKFDDLHKPGEAVPHSGIYRCKACTHEIVSTHGNPFPPQNHHQHRAGQGDIEWQLVTCPK
jgi:hypothetical protein